MSQVKKLYALAKQGVPGAVEQFAQGVELEKQMLAANAPVYEPMAGHVQQWYMGMSPLAFARIGHYTEAMS